MRLVYIDPVGIALSGGDLAAVAERVRQRRHPRGLQPLDRAILHSPAFTDGFNTLMDAVTNLNLPSDISEIAMCRVSIKNRAWYGWEHHSPLAKASGVSDLGMKTLAEDHIDVEAAQSGLTVKQWTVAKYTDAMTAEVEVSDDLFDRLKGLFSDQEVVEITGTVSYLTNPPLATTKNGLTND